MVMCGTVQLNTDWTQVEVITLITNHYHYLNYSSTTKIKRTVLSTFQHQVWSLHQDCFPVLVVS